jgi:uncharacterized protein (DUF1697 family)
MRSVVFLRAANVGRHHRFQPSILAKELTEFGVVNLGAVGTFVVRENVSEKALRTAILRKLPFECEVMICPGKEIVDLVGENPFKGEPIGDSLRPFVTVLAKRPAHLPKLPLYAPKADQWEVISIRITGLLVLSLWRRLKQNRLYPNQVVEKQFRVASTTRNWNTLLKICHCVKRKAEQAREDARYARPTTD